MALSPKDPLLFVQHVIWKTPGLEMPPPPSIACSLDRQILISKYWMMLISDTLTKQIEI